MTTKPFSTKSRAEEIAAQLKAAQEAQQAYDDAIDEAVKNAGRTRVEFVETLYAHFGIEPETTERTDKNGKPVLNKDNQPILVKTDKDESKRIEKLAAALESVFAEAERHPSGNGSTVEAATKPEPVPKQDGKPVGASSDPSRQKVGAV